MIKNPIRWVAVVCVAVTSLFVMGMSYRLLNVLSGPGWCATALGAGKATSAEGTVKGLDACVGLLTIQLKSLATNSYIFGGVIALCLLALIVIVIAGASNLDLTGLGAGLHIGKGQTPATKAATETAAAAVDKATEIAKSEPQTAPGEQK